MGETPACSGPLGFEYGSGGDIRLPCPTFAAVITNSLQPRIAIALFGNPQLCSLGIGCQMQKL
jgi:hypothetical protein